MTADSDRPCVDALSLSDVDEHVYDAIATLEYTGQPTTRASIAEVSGLNDQTLVRTLRTLTERGLLVRTDSSGEPAYEPARRDRSAAPDNPAGPLAR